MTVVFVHGVPETPAVWNALRERIDRPTLALRLPGFGSPRPAGLAGKEAYAAWLADELRALGGPVDLVGHDWGGAPGDAGRLRVRRSGAQLGVGRGPWLAPRLPVARGGRHLPAEPAGRGVARVAAHRLPRQPVLRRLPAPPRDERRTGDRGRCRARRGDERGRPRALPVGPAPPPRRLGPGVRRPRPGARPRPRPDRRSDGAARAGPRGGRPPRSTDGGTGRAHPLLDGPGPRPGSGGAGALLGGARIRLNGDARRALGPEHGSGPRALVGDGSVRKPSGGGSPSGHGTGPSPGPRTRSPTRCQCRSSRCS
ncbi:alpha/beta fold hydrolase [Streptomyces sp. PTY087I2]|uniref:alpha/beta hydrolase n=1 Tax=Streptomyces sp. PTY087I2 TaxID=1819298 RepID=UPI00350E37BE